MSAWNSASLWDCRWCNFSDCHCRTRFWSSDWLCVFFVCRYSCGGLHPGECMSPLVLIAEVVVTALPVTLLDFFFRLFSGISFSESWFSLTWWPVLRHLKQRFDLINCKWTVWTIAMRHHITFMRHNSICIKLVSHWVYRLYESSRVSRKISPLSPYN